MSDLMILLMPLSHLISLWFTWWIGVIRAASWLDRRWQDWPL